jgi:hypothetical protein
MSRARLGSLLALLCGTLFACSLLMQWMRDPSYYPHQPPPRYLEWAICVALFAGAIGLWFQRRWARLTFLIAGSFFLFLCIGVFVGVGCAGTLMSCYRYNLLSQPTLAVSYYFAKVACSVESLQCYEVATFAQPVLTMLTMAVLVKPLVYNNRWRRP